MDAWMTTGEGGGCEGGERRAELCELALALTRGPRILVPRRGVLSGR